MKRKGFLGWLGAIFVGGAVATRLDMPTIGRPSHVPARDTLLRQTVAELPSAQLEIKIDLKEIYLNGHYPVAVVPMQTHFFHQGREISQQHYELLLKEHGFET